MLNNKFVSVKEVIADFYRDTGFNEEVNIGDIAEWTAQCIGLIYQPDTYIKKITGHKEDSNLDIKSYRAELPCDLVNLIAVSVDGYSAIPSSYQFHQLKDGLCCGVDDFTASSLSSGQFIDNLGNVFSAKLGINGTTYASYTIDNGWLTLSKKEGKVCLAYLAYPTDCDGFPMIPDDVTFKEAIKRYITKQIDYIKWRTNPTERAYKELYEHSEQQYNWYIAAASNKAKMPDTNKIESIKRTLLRLRPDINKFSTFFKNLNFQEARTQR